MINWSGDEEMEGSDYSRGSVCIWGDKRDYDWVSTIVLFLDLGGGYKSKLSFSPNKNSLFYMYVMVCILKVFI